MGFMFYVVCFFVVSLVSCSSKNNNIQQQKKEEKEKTKSLRNLLSQFKSSDEGKHKTINT